MQQQAVPRCAVLVWMCCTGGALCGSTIEDIDGDLEEGQEALRRSRSSLRLQEEVSVDKMEVIPAAFTLSHTCVSCMPFSSPG